MHSHRIIAIVAADKVELVAATVANLLDGYQVEFTTALSPTGAAPATHYAASAQVTEAQRNALLALLNPAQGVYGWRGLAAGVDDFAGPTVVTDSSALPAGDPADLRWTFDACCQSLGLQRVQSTPPGF